MRILVLILASDGAPEYIEFQTIWESYMKSNPSVDCYFYKGDPTLEKDVLLKGNTLFINIEDTLETVYEKTLRAFLYFEPRMDQYDFVYRTNLSSFVDFPKYLQFCERLPKSDCCAAVTGDPEGIPFPSGSGFTMSVNLVRRLLEERPPKVVQDDVTIGTALHNWGIQIHNTNRSDCTSPGGPFTVLVPNEDVFHYRVKSHDRTSDAHVLRDLVKRMVMHETGS